MRFVIAMLLLSASCLAQDINFAWDPHPEAAEVVGFKLYQTKGEGGVYPTTPVATFIGGSLTTGSIPKPGLGKYCFVLTAYVEDAESDRSNEVCTTIKPKPPKLLSVLQVALAPVKKAVETVASLVKGKKNLRIV